MPAANAGAAGAGAATNAPPPFASPSGSRPRDWRSSSTFTTPDVTAS
jgi:hypothetical protein